jgi:hypothetical protein
LSCGCAASEPNASEQATQPENRWFWSITVMGPARFRVRTDSRAATLEQAKADFRVAWAAFKVANEADPT